MINAVMQTTISSPVGGRSTAVRVSVCLSVCQLAYLKTTCPNFANFSVHVTRSRGPVLRGQQYNKLCTSGFDDDFMFSHNGTSGQESKMTHMFLRVRSWRQQPGMSNARNAEQT